MLEIRLILIIIQDETKKVGVTVWQRTQHDLFTNRTDLDKATLVQFFSGLAIPIKCFLSHRPPSREGGSVGRAEKK